MKAISSRAGKGLLIGSHVIATDNSGARIVKVVSVKRGKTRKGRQQGARIADHVKVSVRKGNPEMKGQVFDAVVVRQKKPILRNSGERVSFEDNAVVLLKDEKGNPKGTQVKGVIAREAFSRWGEVGKLAKFVY